MNGFKLDPLFILVSICTAFMIGIGLRFLVDGYVNGNLYGVNRFDLVFDWGLLVVFAVYLFVYGLVRNIRSNKKNTDSIEDGVIF